MAMAALLVFISLLAAAAVDMDEDQLLLEAAVRAELLHEYQQNCVLNTQPPTQGGIVPPHLFSSPEDELEAQLEHQMELDTAVRRYLPERHPTCFEA